jgi:hypothetical protein
VRCNRVRSSIVTILVATFAAACNAYGPKPTPALSPTPKPTVTPAATAGPLTMIDVDHPGMTMLSPSTWKKPAPLNQNGLILSPTGSADTSRTAGPFLLVIVDNAVFFHSKFSFPSGLTDPVEQLNALLTALQLDGPQFQPAVIYSGARYPAAITRGFERDNEMTIVLMNAGNDQWIYVGAQAKESEFSYYEGIVFRPATNSITLKSP